uniref:NBR1 autophagy cargo receptor a n=1 Tax=Gasterosteus aculeatus aculeatus TaxID=481459 RepID=A0AAQ4QSM2_GASAC
MNVYKMKGQACGGPPKTEVKELKGDLRPAPPYPSRVKTVDKGTQVTPEREAVTVKDNKGNKPEDEPPPMWFRSYMDKFKDEVVKEVVERMCSDFSGQCCTHKSSDGPLEASAASSGPTGPRPGPSTSTGSLGYTPNCSSCNKLTSEGAYKCSVCPSCILCEMCRHSHDPSHNLVRTKTPLSIPEHGMSGELRFPRRGDRTVRKAERQRLKAERRQLRAEVKEIKKKLRLEKRGLQWSGPSTSGRGNLTNVASASTQVPAMSPPAASETASGPAPAPVPDPQASSPEGPGVSNTSLVSTMAALFLDENLPDGTRLEPGTKFIKYWKMRNSGTISWTAETKLVFMWGNLGLASGDRREVPVPLLLPGQVGVVSVAFAAPVTEGTYTSHWRLAHCGCQFGPRVWCSIVVDAGDGREALGHQSERPEEEEEESVSQEAPLRGRQQEAVDAEDSAADSWPPLVPPSHSSVNQMLCASQTLDAVTLTPEVVPPPPPPLPDLPRPPPALYSPRSEALYLSEDPSPPARDPYEPHQPRVHLNVSSGLSRSAGSASSAFETYNPRPSNALQPRGQGGITEGLVKGALSVAASAYKALFTGPNCSIQRGIDPATRQDPSLMAMLLEMGFRDQRLNQQLLRKHGYSLLHTVNELVQMTEDGHNKALNALH